MAKEKFTRLAIALVLGGALSACVAQTAKVDATIANVNSKLYDNCNLLQAAAFVASVASDDKKIVVLNSAINLYCSSEPVTDTATAIRRTAEIYALVRASK